MQRLSKTKQNLQATENKHSTLTKQAVTLNKDVNDSKISHSHHDGSSVSRNALKQAVKRCYSKRIRSGYKYKNIRPKTGESTMAQLLQTERQDKMAAVRRKDVRLERRRIN